MRKILFAGTMAFASFALAMPLAAQGHGRNNQDDDRSGARGRDVGSYHRDQANPHQRHDQAYRSDRGQADRSSRDDYQGRQESYDRGSYDRGSYDRGSYDRSRSDARGYAIRDRLPRGWEQRVVLYRPLPRDLEVYCRPVPAELDYRLGRLPRGRERVILSDRVLVLDRVTRGIILIINL